MVTPPSSCPGCGQRIAPWNNVPVLGWLLLRGKAACCGTSISVRYPLVEALGGLAAWGILNFVDAGLGAHSPAWLGACLFACYLALCLGLIAAVFIDLEFMLLPDSITLGGAALGLLCAPLRELAWTDSLLGGGIGFAIVWIPFIWLYRLFRGYPGMGLGDAKLLLLAGTWFGWPGAIFALLAGAIQGTIAAVAVYLVAGRIEEPRAVQEERRQLRAELEQLSPEDKAALEAELADDPLHGEPESGLGKARIPFGPFLIFAILEYVFFESWITEQFGLVFLGG